MKISINNKLIEKNKKIAQYTLYISMALLAAGFIWSIRNPDPEKSLIGWAILIPSYFLVQLSIYMSNKWGKSPRPDEIITQSLKGLNDDYTLYTYTASVPHLLIGPQGVWILNPYPHKGEISYDPDKLKYRQKGGGGFIGKYFGQEKLPDLLRDADHLRKDFDLFLKEQKVKVSLQPEIINVFYADKVDLIGNKFPDVCVKADKLKSLVRKESKNRLISDEELLNIKNALPAAG